jgi:hypothetical protein
MGNYLEREEKGRNDRVSKNNEELLKKNSDYTNNLTEAGLFPCTACNDLMQQCRRTFQSKRALDDHEKNGKHKFPSVTTLTEATRMAINTGGVLSSGTFVNRSTAIERDLRLQLILETNIDESERDWFRPGCFNKPKRKKGTPMKAALRADLLQMYEEGDRTNAKISATNALRKLTDMKNSDGSRKYTFNSSNPNGPLPDEKKIKSFFACESLRRKKPATDGDGGYSKMKKDDLQNLLAARDLCNKPGTVLFFATLLTLHDQLDECDDKGDDADYVNWSMADIRQEISNRDWRGLDISKPKTQLISLLELSDLVLESAQPDIV